MVLEAEKSRIKVPADQAASEGPLSSLLAMTAFYWVFTRQKEPGGSLVVRILGFHCQGLGFSPWLGNWDCASLSVQPKRKKRENDSSLSVPILRGPPLWLYLTVCCCLVTKLCPTLCDPMGCSPPRLLCPWNFPGKNTGVGCQFLLQGMKVKSEREVAQSCPTLSNPLDCSLPGSSAHRIFQARVLAWGAITFSEGNPI